jgi:signal transduction histidine kinase
MAVNRAECEQALARAESAKAMEEVIELRRAGRRRAIHLRLFDVNDESGQAIGRGLLLRDVTRERELDEFKTTLLAAVGHEVRTPLAAIKGYASTLLQEDVAWSPADQRHFLETISSEADRLAQLVSNLLDLSRQEAGLLLLKRVPTRMQDLVAKIIKQLNPSGVTISVQLPDDLPLVNIDSGRIEVVLHNLVTNALVYGAGEVCITAERRDDTVIVAVADNGPGIDPDELPHVFERFYRARYGHQQHSGGTGLGLAICKAFIEAHGGAIWAESSVQGTTISFSLPLVSVPIETEAMEFSVEERRPV